MRRFPGAFLDGLQRLYILQVLRAAGKPVELVTLPDEDHWLTNGATRRQALAAVAAFLENNNPPL